MRLQSVGYPKLPASDGYTEASTGGGPDGTGSILSYSTGGSWASAAFFVGRALGYCVVLSCPNDGSPVGTLTIEGSCDRSARGDHPDDHVRNWFPLTLTDPTTKSNVTSLAVNGMGAYALMESACFYRWIRVVYVRTSGSGIFTASVQFKGIGS